MSLRELSPIQQVATDLATTRAPWVRGYINAVLSDLEDSLDGVARLRFSMGPDWDPLPSYEFHIQLAQARIRALHPVTGEGAATTPAPSPATTENGDT